LERAKTKIEQILLKKNASSKPLKKRKREKKENFKEKKDL
jgi:hypothetical protein